MDSCGFGCAVSQVVGLEYWPGIIPSMVFFQPFGFNEASVGEVGGCNNNVVDYNGSEGGEDLLLLYT